jgi:hypothetical protein
MKGKSRRLRTFGLAVVACFALTVVVASAAQARQWTIAGSTLSGSEAVSCSSTTGFTLKGKVLGTEVELHATNVECLSGSKIENSGGAGVDSGTLRFTGVTVTKPALGCEVPGGTLTTNPLKTKLVDLGTATGYDQFSPASGSEFITIPIEECVIAGEYPVTGSITGQGNAWGTEAVIQPLAFSPAVDSATGTHLSLGGQPATLQGTALNRLSGSKEGFVFGAK